MLRPVANSSFIERRAPDRPKNGDTRKTARAASKAQSSSTNGIGWWKAPHKPAWVCDSPACGHQERVRRVPPAADSPTAKPRKSRTRSVRSGNQGDVSKPQKDPRKN